MKAIAYRGQYMATRYRNNKVIIVVKVYLIELLYI